MFLGPILVAVIVVAVIKRSAVMALVAKIMAKISGK